MGIAFLDFSSYIAPMWIKQIKKRNSKAGKIFYQYQLTQSSRVNGKVKHISVLFLGSHPLLREKANRQLIAKLLQAKIYQQYSLAIQQEDIDDQVRQLVDEYYEKYLIKYQEKKDPAHAVPPAEDQARYVEVDVESVQMEQVREIGCEWLCLQILERLELKKVLEELKWDSKRIDEAIVAIISRAILASSEHRTAQWLNRNSALLELMGLEDRNFNRHHLYKAAINIYEVKDIIERHLYEKTVDLFQINDKIVIYDLTNAYFEGRKQSSRIAKFGKSKEKRNDCKQVVLAGVINALGFIKHSEIYEGNMSDPQTLEEVITQLQSLQPKGQTQQTIVIDAGIATEDNLQMLRERQLRYVCVSRSRLKDYQALEAGQKPVQVLDRRQNKIELKILKSEDKPDTWMYVNSEQKQVKEDSILEKLMHRYEAELQQVKNGIQKKGGTKKYEKVWERIGRLKERHKKVHKYYDITVQEKNGIATSLTWQTKPNSQQVANEKNGIYFIRTNYEDPKEEQLWDIYNTIREVEATFRCLKLDLNLRPIFHQKDEHTKAHLFLTIVAYQIVGTIRNYLKQSKINLQWSNIVGVMNTQKIGTVTFSTKDKKTGTRISSRPIEEALEIYKACKVSSYPKGVKKFVVYH